MAITRRPPGVRPLGSFLESDEAAARRPDHAPPPSQAAPPGEPEEDPGRTDPATNAFSVTDLVTRIDRLVSRPDTFGDVWVKGEIAEFSPARSGHWYLTLKDERSQIRGVMWAGVNRQVPFDPEVGMEVLCRGRVTVYGARGTMQIQLTEMQPAGLGGLALQFEQLKRKLTAEGLFEASRKQPIPRYPRIVGVVTSRDGAALRDIVHVATRRHPGIRLLVAHAQVQGEGAAMQVAAGIVRLNALVGTPDGPDVIIVGRGGGSMEDLWAFNEEPVVRAIAASEIPIVSAVGHETDTTLSDHAADLRAATPSAAAETVVPDVVSILQTLDAAQHRLTESLQRTIPELRQRLDDLTDRVIARTRGELDRRRERLDDLSPRVGLGLTRVLPGLRERLDETERRAFASMQRLVAERRQRLAETDPRLRGAIQRLLVQRRERFEGLVGQLNSANPLGVLDRGFAAVMKDDAPLTSVEQVRVGEAITLQFKDGEADARVEDVRKNAGRSDRSDPRPTEGSS